MVACLFGGMGFIFLDDIMRHNKYNAKKVVIDGITFASVKESRRYRELKLLEYAERITDLELQPKYNFILNGIKICSYVADFKYWDIDNGALIVEDVKSEITRKNRAYRIKNKMMKAFHGIDILET